MIRVAILGCAVLGGGLGFLLAGFYEPRDDTLTAPLGAMAGVLLGVLLGVVIFA